MSSSLLWYATRSTGAVALVLLTFSFVLGVATSARLETPSFWRFLTQGLHRSVALLSVVFTTIHVVTAILDPYAGLGLVDATIPFATAYRPLWLGLGVVSMYLLLAVTLTGLIRRQVPAPAWTWIHRASYLAWPTALFHSLGTGSDPASGWFFFLGAACLAAGVAALLAWRLARGVPRDPWLRGAAAAGVAVFVLGLGAWYFAGPGQPGWAKAAGTPARLLRSGG